jgi:adenylate kinase
MGAPGAGKGTIAQLIESKYGFKQISTGDILREETKKETPLGLKAKKFMDKGLFLPDEDVAEIVFKFLNQNKKGIILDGFPRNLIQAKKLEEISKKNNFSIDLVLNLVCEKEILIKRITSRRQCEKCKAIFGEANPSKEKEKCDYCNGKLIQRKDDKELIVRKRFQVFEEKNKGLPDFYKEKNLLKEINACSSIPEVFNEVKKILNEINSKK